jgi:pimeloyl-ACP methyl ester carboxylesterase
MCRLKNQILKKTICLKLSVFIVHLYLTGCGPPSLDANSIEDLFKDREQPVFHKYSVNGRIIHYVEVGETAKPFIVFIHGTPGSWRNFAAYMTDEELTRRASLIAVDRPGFGNSGYKQVIRSLQMQAEYLRPVLERNASGHGALVVGHSLGATIAVRMAMDYPELLCGLVLVAPSLDPELEKPRWYNRLAASSLVRWAVPTNLALANQEVMTLEKELRKMLPLWETINLPVTVIQGEKDALALPANADFAERMLKNDRTRIIRIKDAGHFILWKQPQVIQDAILKALDQNCRKS